MSKRPSASTATPGHQQRATFHGDIHLNLDQDLRASFAHSSFSKLVINQYPATFQWTPEIMGFQTSWFLCVPSPTSQLKQPAVASWPWRLAFPGLRGHHPEPQATRAPNCHGYLRLSGGTCIFAVIFFNISTRKTLKSIRFQYIRCCFVSICRCCPLGRKMWHHETWL